MLQSLSLNNVALIKKQSVEFESGFNCLLGASGAGKSLVISALSFSLGAKADKTLIRSGEAGLRVDAVFENVCDEAKEILNDLEIDYDGELIITRTLTAEGKSSVKINGFPATAKTLKDLAEVLVDFCGQHDSVGLLNVNNHLSLLDKFAGERACALKQEVVSCFENLKVVEQKIQGLGGNEAERERTKDILSFQIKEIENARLEIGEEEDLKDSLNFMSSAQDIFDRVSAVSQKLDGQNESVCANLFFAKSNLGAISSFKEIEECRVRLENAYYEMKDVAEVLEEIRDKAEYDPKELERVDARLDIIKGLKKKYGASVEEVLKHLEKCKVELDELENSEFVLEKLLKEKMIAEKTLENASNLLSEERKKCAKVLEESLMKQLEDLQMKGTFFKVDFQEVSCGRNGADAVKFLFSANKGQEAKDLHKTASGGELSRLMLAFKNVMLEKESVQTVVFDEIDAGISGETAGKLADKLKNISKYMQIICITHTAVVASRANSFLYVEKKVDEQTTTSTVRRLDGNDVVVEIAKLIDGNKDVSQTALEHAKRLLEQK